jgi:DNA-directed RNA polymerase specialized sigma24 family protein
MFHGLDGPPSDPHKKAHRLDSGERSRVEDLVQDVLLKVWCHLATFRSESSFRTWITRVAMNEALQSYRRERCRPLYGALGDVDWKMMFLKRSSGGRAAFEPSYEELRPPTKPGGFGQVRRIER